MSELSGCPFPGCGLADFHEGEHVPRLRLIQRYSWIHSRCEVMALDLVDSTQRGTHRRWCRKPSVAYWETAAGKGVELCADCEEELQEQGAMQVGPSAFTLALYGAIGERVA
jgi:hypothetical protein